MAKFWIATFPLDALSSAGEAGSGDGRPAGLAITVIKQGDDRERAVVFSTVDNPDAPTEFVCVIGFVDGVRSATVGQDLGFPLVDAQIEHKENQLHVHCPAFGSSSAMDYQTPIASITGLLPDPAEQGSEPSEPTITYNQGLAAPDSVFPATWVMERKVRWTLPVLSATHRPSQPIRLRLATSRYPELKPFKTVSGISAMHWSGTADLRKALLGVRGLHPPMRVRRGTTFAPAAFRFEDVEMLGFRIDLAQHGGGNLDLLSKLCEPLNYHLQGNDNVRPPSSSVSDFSYRPASGTLSLELLRYGKMKLKQDFGFVTPDDFQSQHEMMIRVLVGRVDDDTAQARDAASFVPAIFVDNPWSKVLGRTLQGFDKHLAEFCVPTAGGLAPVRPDGRLLAGKPEPLGTVAEIRLKSTNATNGPQNTLLKMQCRNKEYPGWDDLKEVDLDLAFRPFTLAPMRWRRSDFRDPEFARSFSRDAVHKSRDRLRSIQVSPVGADFIRKRLGAETTWITGDFLLDRGVKVTWPDGIVGLTCCSPPGAPPAWTQFCNLIGTGDSESRIALPRGSWYRMLCSMDLVIHNQV